jgi:uncharacterized membrane protein YhdT
MSKCDLAIEIEDPTTPRVGGEVVRGKVIVTAHSEVRCKGLSIQTNWRTHGRGNIKEGMPNSVVLFVGDWAPGQRAEYPFEIALHTWPPTHRGYYINVDHFVIATASVPWAFDPMVSVPIEVIVNQQSAQPASEIHASQSKSGIILWIVAALLIGGALFTTSAPVRWFLTALLMAGMSFAAVRWWMPKWMLGKIDLQWDEIAMPGQTLKGRLTIDPKRNLSVGPLEVLLIGAEIATSGSGSNRKTHTHEFLRLRKVIADRLEIKAGLRTEVGIEIVVPEDSPPSMSLGDNEIKYRWRASVGISKWPDWRLDKPICVGIHPNGVQPVSSLDSWQLEVEEDTLSETEPVDSATANDNPISFDELIDLLWDVRDSEGDRDRLIDAVAGIPLDASAILQQRLPNSIRQTQVDSGDYVVSGYAVDPPLPLLLFAGSDAGDEFAEPKLELWQGRAEVLGWDESSDRLKLLVLERRKYSK